MGIYPPNAQINLLHVPRDPPRVVVFQETVAVPTSDETVPVTSGVEG